MEALILSFRRGRHTQRTNQFLLEVEGVDSKAKAINLIGKKVVWISPAKKKIYGKISGTHGNKGIVRAIFEKGLPGTALKNKIKFLE